MHIYSLMPKSIIIRFASDIFRLKGMAIIVMTAFLLAVQAVPVHSGKGMNVVVKTILASHGEKFVDPGISDLIKELQSVFGYSSYRLLGNKEMKLRIGERGEVILPGKRLLKILPTKVTRGRVELKLVIIKEKKVIFQTVIKLKNNSSITVGGPKHQGGVLLFNILSSF